MTPSSARALQQISSLYGVWLLYYYLTFLLFEDISAESPTDDHPPSQDLRLPKLQVVRLSPFTFSTQLFNSDPSN
ncbi:hypothetical protein L2E82_01620 [Cichorium intybus]|uniref:Uncharacterized protein n=1 Tax=Cichorium intybus TaxID=13427 RepID=A0ACB9GZF2_CICIN|nr:hypothetical protein L2E82_01620 [Cichorium intybus]